MSEKYNKQINPLAACKAFSQLPEEKQSTEIKDLSLNEFHKQFKDFIIHAPGYYPKGYPFLQEETRINHNLMVRVCDEYYKMVFNNE